MTIRTSLMIAAVVAITFSSVTERSFSSPVKIAAAATPQDCCCNPVKNVYKIVPKGGNPNCSNPCKNAGKKGAR